MPPRSTAAFWAEGEPGEPEEIVAFCCGGTLEFTRPAHWVAEFVIPGLENFNLR